MKFTFKTHKPTGKWKAFSTPTHYIKLGNVLVGRIDDEHPHKIRLMVIKDDIMENGNPNCAWKWVCLTKNSNSISEAKEFINKYYDEITSKYNIVKS